jgi:hypothetical protein
MEQRPQLDRTYLPTPATTVEMYLNAILEILVEIRDRQHDRAERAHVRDAGSVA